MQYYVHNLNPIAIDFLGVKIAWYWLAYFFGYFWTLYLGKYLIKREELSVSFHHYLNYLFSGFFVMLAGGKLFYIFFYNFSYYAADLKRVLYFWEGGMSFHGALIGGGLWTYYYARKHGLKFFALTDIVLTTVGPGIMFGRIANFINGELAGRVSDVPWAVIFPKLYDSNPRHPSQLYEAFLEGLVLFLILFILKKNLKRPALNSGLFLIIYGIGRFIVEFFRTPDPQIGLFFNLFSVGQFYCFAMILIGVAIIFWPSRLSHSRTA
ncbi:prolipoprotein diacylglyceryl transferase [Halobacteriovorax sp. CON-3]|uniref:prolipoprotein diacylglyceryl transferase n=1 Tax=Halobacteriovorax sp. CON-3 TaxID=3157710 RepID=UPI0037110050